MVWNFFSKLWRRTSRIDWVMPIFKWFLNFFELFLKIMTQDFSNRLGYANFQMVLNIFELFWTFLNFFLKIMTQDFSNRLDYADFQMVFELFLKTMTQDFSNRLGCTLEFTIWLGLSRLDCPLSKENQAPNIRFERPNGKISKSKNILTSVKNWWVQLTCKLNEEISLMIWLKTNQNKWKSMTFFIFLHLKPIPLLY